MDSQKSFFATPKKAFIFIVCVLAALSVFIIGTTYAVTAIVNSNKQAANDKGNVVFEEDKMADDGNAVKGREMLVIEDDTTVVEEESPTDGGGVEGQSGVVNLDMEVEEAKTIAVGHAGFSVSDVNFSKTKLEKEHGTMVYEIEFYKDGMEYEYEINAETGEIIKSEVDRDD